jgi:hypothetical protein
MRKSSLSILALLLAACGGGESLLPGAIAPTTPPITQVGATDLEPIGPTTFSGQPKETTILRVRATRADGGPAHAVTIVFQVQAGGGAMQPIVTSTDEQGVASAEWTFGPKAAVNHATATGGFATAPVSFTVSTFATDGTAAP